MSVSVEGALAFGSYLMLLVFAQRMKNAHARLRNGPVGQRLSYKRATWPDRLRMAALVIAIGAPDFFVIWLCARAFA